MSWCIEPAKDDNGRACWALQDAPGERGDVFAHFYDRVAATACLRGFREIGFTPRRRDTSPVGCTRDF